jgi:hypothetical protein
MEFNNPKFTTKDKIELLQSYILVNSYLYYHLDYSRVSDEAYDRTSQQLLQFMKDSPIEFSTARYSYAMKDFDGSTGFGFVDKLNEADKKSMSLRAEMLIRF